MEVVNYPIAYAPMSIDYPDEYGNMIHIGYIPNMCYVVELKRIYNSDGTYKNRYQVVFVDKIIDFENKKIENNIPKYEIRYYDKCYVNADYVDDIAFDYSNMEKICRRQSLLMYRTKHFNLGYSMKCFDYLEDCKNMLNELHSKNSAYKTLCLNIGNAKL